MRPAQMRIDKHHDPISMILRLALAAFAAGSMLVPAAAQAGAVQKRVADQGAVRVCIWPDYYGITFRNPRSQQLVGIDIDLSAEFARQLGAKLQYVETSFAKFVGDLTEDRCDVAMFAVGITPQRSQALRFSRPYLSSDIYGITTRSNKTVRSWEDIDRPGILVGVQAGTLMEPVMVARLKQAKVVVIAPPQTREQELEAGRIDVFMSDYPYSRRLLDNADWARVVSPTSTFNLVSYGYAVKPGDDEWLRAVDSFVEKIRAGGRLAAAAKRHGLSEIVARD